MSFGGGDVAGAESAEGMSTTGQMITGEQYGKFGAAAKKYDKKINKLFSRFIAPAIRDVRNQLSEITSQGLDVVAGQKSVFDDAAALFRGEGVGPVKDFYDAVAAYSAPGQAEVEARRALGAVGRQEQLAAQSQARRQSAIGWNPNSGAAQGDRQSDAVRFALAKAGAANQARDAATKMGFELKGQAGKMALGAGELANQAGAQVGSNLANLGNMNVAGLNATSNAVNDILGQYGNAAQLRAGMVGTGAGLWGAGTSAQMEGQKIQNEQDAAFGEGIGGILGLAMPGVNGGSVGGSIVSSLIT